MSGQSNGHTPPTSTSSQPSPSSSSKACTWSTRNDNLEIDLSHAKLGESETDLLQNAHANAADEGHAIAGTAEHENRRRRHRPRQSGGFLLETTTPYTQETLPYKEVTPESPIARGKRKVEDGDLYVPKRTSALHRHRLKPSVGSSPLATEILHAQSGDRQTESEGNGGNNRSSTKSAMAQPNNSSGVHGNHEASHSNHENLHTNHTSAMGHDTDPAQIVSLALNLSESRRRNFSGGGLLAPRDLIGNLRTTSQGQPTLGIPYAATGGNLRQSLEQQRRISRNPSPRSGKSGKSGSSKGNRTGAPQQSTGNRMSSRLLDFEAGINNDAVFDASDATFTRAEKARITLELGYEYRRLLQYLPPIPIPSQTRPTTSKTIDKSQSGAALGLGRSYDPLQYIRNRRVRFRERRPLNAEADGWKDLDRVRTWVSMVGSEREDGVSRIDDPFPLPPFDTIQASPNVIDDLEAPSVAHANPAQPKKPASERRDWTVAPWDLLADVQWLNQDDNIAHIEDSSGDRIFTDRMTHKADLPRASKELERTGHRQSASLTRHNASPDRLRTLASPMRDVPRDRGRRKWSHEPQSPVDPDHGSRDRKSRWPRKLMRSRSSTSSQDSHWDKPEKHPRGREYHGSIDHLDDAALEKQMMEMLAQEAEETGDDIEVDANETENIAQSNADREHSIARIDSLSKEVRQRPRGPQRLKTDLPASHKRQASARPSLDEERLGHHRMSSDDFSTTAPSSPTVAGFVPSIAINLSPPANPPTSTASPKKPFPSRLANFRRSRSRSIDRRGSSENDLAKTTDSSTNMVRSSTNDSHNQKQPNELRNAELSNGFLSPRTNEPAGGKSRSLDSKSIRGLKGSSGSDSKLRGFFKGSRIAELVGNEVSKVGDIFWKKDSSNNASQIVSPVSTYASEESNLDDGDADISGFDSSPNDDLSRATTNNEGMGKLSQRSTNSDKPKYFMSNLPSFRSPFNRDESPKSTQASPDHDHISRQQLAQEERGRSDRFARLAPPKIDMRNVSPSPSHSHNRSQSRVPEVENSQESSTSRSNNRIRLADRRLNDMLGIPGNVGRGSGAPAPSGLTALGSRAPSSQERPGLEGKRQWSISDRGISAVQGTITRHDIARVRALLLSSGVKANEITRRAEQLPEKPSPLLQNLKYMIKEAVPHVPRSQEHLVAVRILVNNIESTNRQLRDAAERFSKTTVEGLHNQIKAIDERVTYKLTPLVRASADDADAFSTELTTTHTLSVKQLNDSIDVILRRRQRRLRWIRRGGWAILEWTLLGIMWLAWLIVVIVRVVKGSIGAFVMVVRWLLCL